MRNSNRAMVLLAGACMMAGVAAWGQQAGNQTKAATVQIDVAAVYDPTMANAVGGDDFRMQGGSLQFHGQFCRGLGVVLISPVCTQGTRADRPAASAWIWSQPPSAHATHGRRLIAAIPSSARHWSARPTA